MKSGSLQKWVDTLNKRLRNTKQTINIDFSQVKEGDVLTFSIPKHGKRIEYVYYA